MFKTLLHLTSTERSATAQQTLITSERGKSSPSGNESLTHGLGLMEY